jgi:hypothetical protein
MPSKTAAKTTTRLGDDAPRLQREPVSVIVARSDIAGGKVRITSKLDGPLRVAKGQVLHVKHPYRIQEDSEDREEYRFLLRSSLAGEEHPPSLARIGDKWGVPEDVAGYLVHPYTCKKACRFTLEFEAGAEYCVMDWGETDVKALDRKDLKGTVDVVVV